MANVIKIKRSTGSSVPNALAQGELAYSGALDGSNLDVSAGKLYIGSPGTTASLVIGGTFYTNLLSATNGTASASKAVLLDASSSVSSLGTVGASTFTGTIVNGGNLRMASNTLSSTDTNGAINLLPNGTGSISVYGGTGDAWTLPRAKGTDTWVLTSNGSGAATWKQPVSVMTYDNGAGSTSTVNLLTQTFSIVGGSGINTTVDGTTLTIAVDAGEGIVTTTGYQTLTNKTMDGLANTFTNITNQSLVNSKITLNGYDISLGGTQTLTTTNISEGTNLYYTDARARAALAAATTNDGFGNLTYSTLTGTFTFAKVTASDVRGTMSAATTGGGFGSLSYDAAGGTFTFATVTASQVRGTLSSTSTAGYGSLAYDNASGTFTFTAVTDANIRERLSAGTTGTGFGDLQYTTSSGAFTLTKVSAADIRGTLSTSVTPGGGFGNLQYDSGTGVISFTQVTATDIRTSVSAANSGSGYGTLSYTTSTGEFSFAKVTDAEIRGTLSGGTGVTYNTTSGVISIGQNVATTASVTFNSVTLGNTATFGTYDAVTKSYVDSVAQGLDPKASVRAASTASLVLNGEQTIDGVAVVSGDRVLAKNQSTTATNGIYIVQSGAWTRSPDMNEGSEFPSAFTFVEEGTTQADTGWVCTTNAPVTLDVTPITWVQFSGAGQYTASNGITLVGNDFQLASSAAGNGLGFASGVLSVNVNTATLVITGDAIDIAAGGVTNAMLQNSSFSLAGNTGTPSAISLGSTATITGSGAISTAATAGTITISVADADTGTKGVASFSSTNFSVSSGAVSIKAGGVDLTTNVTGTLPAANGGTGINSYAVGDLVYASGATALSKLAATATGYALISAGVTTAPTYGKIGLTTHVEGTLPVANGGTGATSFTATNLLIGDGTNPVATNNALSFTATKNVGGFTDTSNVLTVGGGTVGTRANGDLVIAATGTNANIVLVPNGTGIVDIGGPASGSSSLGTTGNENLNITAGGALTLTGGTTATLVGTSVTVSSTASDITMQLAAGTSYKVAVSGPTAADYATGIADNDLVNAYWVQNVFTVDGGTY